MKRIIFFLLIFSIFHSQQRVVKRAVVGFLNVENLWDTKASVDYIDGNQPLDSPLFHRSIPEDSLEYLPVTEVYRGVWRDSLLIGKKVIRKQILNTDFTPSGNKKWTEDLYKDKLSKISKVIANMGRNHTHTAPAIVGLIEVENRQVVMDLVNEPELSKENYQVVHFNSYDARGIDVALIYQKKRFDLHNKYKKEISIFNEKGQREYTRDILVIQGLLDGEFVAVLLNHWPSRRGGVETKMKRNMAAKILKEEMDKIREQNPHIKIIAMGDFNDNPNDESLTKFLSAVGREELLSDEKPYFNPMFHLFKKGVASYAYNDAPCLFDQMIISKNLIQEMDSKMYKMYRTEIYAPSYLITPKGLYKGYPFRSWVGNQYTGGYSDHFPVYMVLQREVSFKK